MSSSLKDKLIEMAENKDDFNQISNSNFMLPDMGEMVQEDLMSEILQQYANGDLDQEYISEEKSVLDASFYTETPFTLTPGYYSNEGAFILKVKTWGLNEFDKDKWDAKWDLNKYDGDTIDFDVDELDDNDESFTLSKHNSGSITYKNFKDYFKKMNGSDRIQIRFVGMDAAEIPHYEIQPVLIDMKDKVVKDKMTFKEVKALKDHNTTVLYENCPYYNGKVHTRKDEDEVQMLLLDDGTGKKKYVEIITRLNGKELFRKNGGTPKENYEYYVVLGQNDESTSNLIQDGYNAQMTLRSVIEESDEIILMINANGLTVDKNPISTTKTFNSVYYLDDIVSYLADQWDSYYQNLPITNYSYIPYGMDNYKRSLGVIYAKYKGSWINVNKYIICNTEHTIIDPSFNSSPELQQIGNGLSDSFNLWSYHRDNIEWLDSFSKISENSYKNKLELHKKYTGIDFTQVRDCKLIIGDTLLLLPPENIRNVTQTYYERIPNMRSKGTMAKDKANADNMLEITLYFYEDQGINGIPYEYTAPNGTTMTYYLNGLRSLVAQFKIAPFLPIENGFINDVLGIEAVALENLSIQNVDGVPRLLKAILTLKEFNYRVYMPDMPIDDNDDTTSIAQMTPMFAKCFNWEIFRYYYQRSIMAGDRLTLLEKQGLYGSYDYNLEYYTTKNSVGKFLFCGELGNKGSISFYIPDETWLNNALQVKKQKDSTVSLTTTSSIDLSDNARTYVNKLARLTKIIEDLKDSETNDINKKLEASLESFIGKANKKELEIYISTNLLGKGDSRKHESIDTKYITSVETKNEKGYNFINKYVLPLKKTFIEIFNNPDYFSDLCIDETVKRKADGSYVVTWDFCIILNTSSITDDEWRDIKEIASKRYDNIEIEDIFIDKKIRISYEMKFIKDGLNQAKLVSDGTLRTTFTPVSSTEEEALSYLITSVENEDDLNDIDNDYINENNQEIDFYVKDYKNPANMPFVPYVEDVLCSKMLGNISNTFTEVSIKAIEGIGPQYMGGQDSQLQFEMITDDIAIVGALNALPTLASAMAKKYRRILPAWPIKIQSDLTRLLGISEVLIDMIEVSTVDGFPGVYSIAMRLTSVDRTQRQREALRRLDVAPQGGKVGYDYNSDLSMRNYFALDSALAEAELYPDLDLPTISELGQLGFRFVKYTGQNRSYPDPDFYIVYSYPYTSMIIKKMIKDVISENLLNEEGDESLHSFDFKDVMGCEVTGKIEAYTGLNLTDKGDNSKKYSEILEGLELNINEKLANNKNLTKKDKDQVVNTIETAAAIKKLILSDVVEGWEIKPGWKAPLASKELNQSLAQETKDAYAQEIYDKRKKAIELIDDILSNPISDYVSTDKYIENQTGKGPISDTAANGQYNDIEKMQSVIQDICEDTVNRMFIENPKGKELLQLLCPTITLNKAGSKFNKKYFSDADPLNFLTGFLYASGCALSGNKEFASNVDDKDWAPNHYLSSLNYPSKDTDKDSEYYGQFLPYCITEKIAGSPKIGTSIKEDINSGIVFGAWRLTHYSNPNVLVDMAEKEINLVKYMENEKLYDKVQAGFIDPYYNGKNNSDKELLNYKKGLLLSVSANSEAFLRNVLVSLRKMLCDGLLISELDIMVNDLDNIYKLLTNDVIINEADDPFNVIEDTTTNTTTVEKDPNVNYENVEGALEELGFDKKEIQNMFESLKKTARKAFCSRFIYPFLMTVVERNDDVYELYKDRNYSKLNGLTSYIEYGTGTNESKTKVIKFLSALSGIKMTLVNSTSKSNTVSTSQQLMNSMLKDIFIKASEDPRAYLVHSFYDMLTNDKRGRLVRAFPTYYVVFIDEGRKIGSWKLHDNFYNMNSISSINIVKSRKIAADTCTIVMNNMFNSYTMEADSTTTQQYTDIYGLRDVFDSIFSPQAYFDKEKRIRLRKELQDTVVLQPGIRIHVRMGYSADGSKLPVVFNGKVADLDVQEVAQIVAQGDGHELMNPLTALGDIEALSLDPSQSTFTWFKDLRGSLAKGGETPRDLLAKVLCAKYGGIKKVIDVASDARWYNENPFGIKSFGDPKFIEIFEQGELVQNLYEVADSTLLKNTNTFENENYGSKISPTINTTLQDKTFWDLLHLAANSGENYIGAIRDFGFRSTVFLGKPNHYYAYAYELVDGKIVEKRKPFQQFHYYDSYTDIVYNSIKASESQMKTNAVGTWQSTNWWWGREQSTVGPIYLDMNIYPEYQKSMTVDTGLLGAGNGFIDLNFTTHFGEKFSTSVNDDKVNARLAERVTANVLKNSVKDMYLGDVCVLGDPSVKPYDRVYIHDTYEDMQGMFEVEAVIHNMSAETGYTTSVMPDVIVRHGSSYETATQSLMNVTGGTLAFGIAAPIVANLWGASIHGKLANVIGKSNKMHKSNSKLAKLASNFYEVSGMKDFLDEKPTTKALFNALNVLPNNKNIELEAISSAINALLEVKVTDLDNMDNLAKTLINYTKLDLDNFEDAVKKAYSNNKYGFIQSKYTQADLDKIMKEIKATKSNLEKFIDVKTFNASGFADDILKLTIDGKQISNYLSKESLAIIKEKWAANKVDDAAELITDLSKVLQEDEILKAIKNKNLQLDKADDVIKGFKSFFDVVEDVDGKTVSRFASFASKLKGGDLLDDLITVFKGAAKANWATLLIDVALEVGTYLIIADTKALITSFLESIQAIDVYPLMKFNKPLIAGMNGHKGSVYGWPVQEGYDSIQMMIVKVIETLKGLDGGTGGKGLADWITGIFVDDNVFSRLSQEWREDLGLDPTTELSDEELAQTTYSNISSMYAAKNNKAYSLIVIPRVVEKQLKSSTVLKKYQITNVSTTSLVTNEQILSLSYIGNNAVIEKAMLDDRFVIAHSEKPDYVINIPFESGVSAIPVKMKNETLDMPLVRDELIMILEYLLSKDSIKENKIHFKSGIQVNKKNSINSTGYKMILEIKGDADLVADVLDEYKNSINILKEGDGVFGYSKDGDKITIIAYPPSIDINDSEKENSNE